MKIVINLFARVEVTLSLGHTCLSKVLTALTFLPAPLYIQTGFIFPSGQQQDRFKVLR